MKTPVKILVTGLFTTSMLSLPALAGVTETDGLGTSWLGTPTFMTVASQAGGTTAENNYVGGSSVSGSAGGLGGLGQTFVNTTAGNLSNIQMSVGGSSGHSFTIALYDLGSSGTYTPATSATFTPGSLTDLFSPGLSYIYNGGAGGAQNVAQLTFSGVDAVALTANEVYAFTIEPTTSGTQPSWYRGGATAFTGGQAFRDGQFSANNYGALNGAIRDFDMAVTVAPVPEPTTLALFGMGLAGIGAMVRRRK